MQFYITGKYLRVKLQVVSRRLHTGTVSTKLVCPTFYLLWSAPADTAVYRSCPRTIHGRGISARRIFPQLTLFLELSKACVLLKRRARAATFHIARPRRKSYPRTTCYARHIRCKSTSPKARLLGVEVPNELPLKSNSALRSLRR